MPDKDYFVWPIANAINSGSWSLTGYNTDIFPHTLQVAFHVNELGANAGVNGQVIGSSSALLPADVTSSVATPVSSLDPLSPDFLVSTIPTEIDAVVPA